MGRKGVWVRNPVYVLKPGQSTNGQERWLILDFAQQQFYARADVALDEQKHYSIDYERMDATTIRITNALDLSDNPYLP